MGVEKFFLRPPVFEPITLQPVASRYADCAVAAQFIYITITLISDLKKIEKIISRFV